MSLFVSAWRWVRRSRGLPTLEAVNAAEHAEVLAAYAAVRAKVSELEREKRRLRKVVDAIPADRVFDGWRKRLGEPAEVVDHDAVRDLLAAQGLAVPKRSAEPPLIVEFVGEGEVSGGR